MLSLQIYMHPLHDTAGYSKKKKEGEGDRSIDLDCEYLIILPTGSV